MLPLVEVNTDLFTCIWHLKMHYPMHLVLEISALFLPLCTVTNLLIDPFCVNITYLSAPFKVQEYVYLDI